MAILKRKALIWLRFKVDSYLKFHSLMLATSGVKWSKMAKSVIDCVALNF